MNRALRAQGVFARKVREHGDPIVYKPIAAASGRRLMAIVEDLSPGDAEYVPIGEANVGESVQWCFYVSPVDLPVAPDLGGLILWRDMTLTIFRRPKPVDNDGLNLMWRLFTYLPAPPDVASAETAAEPTPGKRKDYLPQDATT